MPISIEEKLKNRVYLLEKKLARAEATARVSKIAGVAPTAIDDVVDRVLQHFDVGDDANLRVKPNTGTVIWETVESLVGGMRSTAGHLFSDAGPRGKGDGPFPAQVAAMTPEQKLEYANLMAMQAEGV